MLYKIRKSVKRKVQTMLKLFKKAWEDIKLHIQVGKEYLNRKKIVETDTNLGNNTWLYYWNYALESCKGKSGYENLGDYLSKVVVSHFMSDEKHKIQKTKPTTIYAIGSVIGFRCQNAVVWGSGILHPYKWYKLRAKYSSFDIRAVRGPKTRQELLKLNKQCPEVYGDPAILMPYVFNPGNVEKKYDVTVILNWYYNDFEIPNNLKVNVLDIITTDYEDFITQICQSKLVISSSLHGIILAETYGVPAVLLYKPNESIFKFEDWYYSTGRYNVIVAQTIKEAMTVEPMELPNLKNMQDALIKAFPSDVF